MVRLFFGFDGEFDLEAPIFFVSHFSPEEEPSSIVNGRWESKKRERFIAFFRELFPDATVEDVTVPKVFTHQRGKSKSRKWLREELTELLNPGSNTEKQEKLTRSAMSVGMRRGQIIPEYRAWLARKNLTSQQYDAKVQDAFIDEVLEDADT